MNIESTQRLLSELKLPELFIDELGWSQPTLRRPLVAEVQGAVFHQRMVAQLAGVAVFMIWPDAKQSAVVPPRALRDAIERDLAKQFRENLCIFVDREHKPTQSFWVWAKRGRDAEGKPKRWLREHSYFLNQPTDLFVGKLQGLFFELADVAEGSNLTVVKVAQRLQSALDVERVTKQFFREYQAAHVEFLSLIDGLADERQRRWYASVLLNRLMFVWFLQKKGFLDHDEERGHGNYDYLADKLRDSQARGADLFYKAFLAALFFDAFAKPEADRAAATHGLCGAIPYLNGGLFLEHPLELDEHKRLRIGTQIKVPDRAFENLFALFSRYSWSLDDRPGGQANEINPDVLGYIFERYINVVSTHSQKDLGAYYTRPEITGYLAERTIEAAVLQRINQPALPEMNLPAIEHDSVPELLARMDAGTALKLLNEVLPQLTILDPAVGSGAFLVAAMKVLINIYSAIVGRAKVGNDPALKAWLAREQAAHRNVGYAIRRRIITNNLYGVDLLEGAAEIAKLRLFLALVASAQSLDELEPLPNIDFNLLQGNSLIGLMRVDEHELAQQPQMNLLAPAYRDLVAEKNRGIEAYKSAADSGLKGLEMRRLRDEIEAGMTSTEAMLDEVLMHRFHELGIRFEQATWDAKKGCLGKPTKRVVTGEDVVALHPFHWGYVFDKIMQNGGGRGGFDIILANPPWEVFKPQAKEFFSDHSDVITKNKMTIHDFEDKQDELLKSKPVREAWLQYQSRFPHVNQYFRHSLDYCHQFATVDGRRVGSDLNLYKLFVERCWRLLRSGGHCGIVVPGSLYSDLGAKGLREMLFVHTRIEGMFGFENRKAIFDGVHRSFKFVVLTFEKLAPPRLRQAGESNASAPPNDLLAGTHPRGTERFPAAFMRHDVEELARFPDQSTLWLDVDLIRKLSPDSHSVLEFGSGLDLVIAKKMWGHPLLKEHVDGAWRMTLSRELHMTDDSDLFKTKPLKGHLPLFEGKMIHQYVADFAEPKYWLDEKEVRLRLLGRERIDDGRALNYQQPRLAFREIARNTDERTMIATMLPPNVFANHKLTLVSFDDGAGSQLVALSVLAQLNSFVFDFVVRQRVSSSVSMHAIYQLPMPRVGAADPRFGALARRSAALVCTDPRFDVLAKAGRLSKHSVVNDSTERARLRAEIDGLAAHLYGLTEEEFAHILASFPLVADPVKVAARNAYRDVAKGLLQ
jgi:hypothetical protein